MRFVVLYYPLKSLSTVQGRVFQTGTVPLTVFLDMDGLASFQAVTAFAFLRKVTGEVLTECCC